MSKQVNPDELAKLVTSALTEPHRFGIAEYSEFMTDIAKVMTKHLGGEVRYSADCPMGMEWLVGIHRNEYCPANGGIWADVDPEGEL